MSGSVTRLYVGNLPAWISKGQLAEIFSRCGTVKDVYVPRKIVDGSPGKDAYGYAFVEMAEQEELVFAIHMFHMMWGPGGERMTVKIANQRSPK